MHTEVRPGDAFTDGKDQWELMDEDELLLDAKIAVEVSDCLLAVCSVHCM